MSMKPPRPLDVAVFLGSVVIAIGRFLVPGHGLSWSGTYEAFAHLWVGFLFGVLTFRPADRWFVAAVLFAITMLETVLFLLR